MGGRRCPQMEKTVNKGVIRLGDRTAQGCTVIQVKSEHFTVLGRPVARVGDLCRCAMPGRITCVIVEGNAAHTIDGQPVAYDGHKTSCGSALRPTTAAFSAG